MLRRLCAIMFTDIQGYTKLMQESEKTAVATRHKHRTIFEPITRQFGGEIIQYYGDGTLSIFDSSVKAVECARALQVEFLKEPSIPVRIGIHTGDIIITEDDIIGDSVNLASRIESLGVPGSVLVSGKVADEIRGQEHLPLHRIGSFHFKNDAHKREVFALDLPGFSKPDPNDIQGKLEIPEKQKKKKAAIWQRLILLAIGALIIFILWNSPQSSFQNASGKRLAVLPFTNLAGDPDQLYLVDGIHEAIISELQQAGIDVETKTTMVSYRNTNKSTDQISEELNANVLVEGMVLRVGDAIQIKISLLDGLQGKYLWSETYDSEMTDLFTLYRDVTKSIAKEIEVALTPQVEARLATITKLNPKAYDLYLRGRSQFNLGNSESLLRAVAYYEEAMAIDPQLDLTYTSLIETYLLMGFGGIDPYVAHTNFRISMEKAMQHNPALRSDYHLQAMIKIFSDWNWKRAEEDLLLAINANPNSSEVFDSYCQFLWAMGRTVESVEAGRKAVALDPNNHFASCNLSWAYYINYEFDQAEEQLKITADSFGWDCQYHYHLKFRLLMEKTDDPQLLMPAIEEYSAYLEKISPGRRGEMGLLAALYADAGMAKKGTALLDGLPFLQHGEFVDPCNYAYAYVKLGDFETALDYLEAAFLQRSFYLIYSIKPKVFYGELHDQPRYQALLRKMDLDF